MVDSGQLPIVIVGTSFEHLSTSLKIARRTDGRFHISPGPYSLRYSTFNMPITPQQIQRAQGVQLAAARDASAQVRLIAGPGTGKSFSIEERVCWLLAQNVPPRAIVAISFTRASATELRNRIQAHCAQHGHAAANQVPVSTLHSLALRILRAASICNNIQPTR